jgi:hypothetical protein
MQECVAGLALNQSLVERPGPLVFKPIPPAPYPPPTIITLYQLAEALAHTVLSEGELKRERSFIKITLNNFFSSFLDLG